MSLLRLAACAAIIVSQSFSQVVINEVLTDPNGVDTGEERIELKNTGSGVTNLAGYDLSPDGIGFFTFPGLSLAAGARVIIHLRQTGTNSSTDVYDTSASGNMGNSSGYVALFNSTTHSSSTLISYVQWGAPSQVWSAAAVSAGRWSSTAEYGPAVAEGHSLEYDGSGVSPSDWFDQANPTIGAENALPVTWATIQARAIDNGVLLAWTTEEESDNYGFSVERRRLGGQDDWRKMGFVPSQGVHAAGASYRFVDHEATGGRYAYRLRQIDRSGSSSVSWAVEIDLTGNARGNLLRAYPNPFNPSVNVEFRAATAGGMNVEVFDLRGSKVAVLFDGVADADKLYSAEFNAGSLPSGVYFVRSSGSRILVARIELLH